MIARKMKIISFLGLILVIGVCADDGITNHTSGTYDPAQLLSKIFNTNITREDESDIAYDGLLDNEPRQYGLVFDNADRPIKFDDYPQNSEENQSNNSAGQKKRRRRRRKPKTQQIHENPGYPIYPQGFPQSDLGPHYLTPGNPGYQPPNEQYYKPTRQPPRVPIASGALSAISGALTSIALYDDYQCVPRLLCEAAGGGALGTSSLLQSVAGLQPLLTLLSAYNGISSSPLFVFGRAVFLGMTSKGNSASCRYAYPQCPTDPEKLVHYLNNHNGGFFKFFNAPNLYGQQNLEQFYQQLSGEKYGLYQNPNGHQNNQANHFSYGLQKPGLYNNQDYYGSGYNYDRLNNYKGKSGFEERIQNKPSNFINDDDDDEDDDLKSKWSFPDSEIINNNFINDNNGNNGRDRKSLRFPDEFDNNDISSQTFYGKYDYYGSKDNVRKGKTILFPEDHDGKVTNDRTTVRPILYSQYIGDNPKEYVRKGKAISFTANQNQIYNKYATSGINNDYPPTTTFDNEDYVYDYEHNFYVKKDKVDDGVRTIYVVRGNGDPNNPEIIRIKSGQSLA